MRDTDSRNSQSTWEGGLDLDALIKILKQNTVLWEYINRDLLCNTGRVKLLHEIVLEADEGTCDKLKDQVYLYGSMIKGQDLMARQMFLWMLLMLDEKIGKAVP